MTSRIKVKKDINEEQTFFQRNESANELKK